MNNRIFRRSCAACMRWPSRCWHHWRKRPIGQGAAALYPTAETSYDNAFASDESSQTITERINEPMLEYHYLARLAKLVPRTLEALPAISDNGATFLCKLQKGVGSPMTQRSGQDHAS